MNGRGKLRKILNRVEGVARRRRRAQILPPSDAGPTDRG